ncbi:MAG TPA: tRNA (N6-isopentenyl adenosine(37)-C2)-methylthiotransferase MiaB [Verrucomicrobiales bacterium]|nr:tRNA (N6-isopentenyl adenosine(37)-C2)-methylthiotransferase MiaB [Verrucomicrobiales bacterium]
MPKVFLRTFGCQMNERDSEQVAQMFVERGFTVTPQPDDADVVLMNTCSVRDQAEQKALGNMHRLGKHRKNNPNLVFGMMGCMAQSRGDQLLKEVPHLDLVAGTQKYHRVVDHCVSLMKAKEEAQMDDLRLPIVDIEEEVASQNTIRDHIVKDYAVSEFVSIMQGCNMKCTFCIVPFTRGSERARPIAEIVDECKRLADQGVREVTLLGQIVNLYGRHEFPKVDGKSPFVQLLEAVHEIDGIKRIRFTSPHPIGYKEDVIEAFTYLPKLVDHVHFPMQSGSDRILKRMHRPYKAERFIEICEQMKVARPGIAISTDIIVGFPGETEEDYLETKKAVETLQFDQAFVFRYSQRKDTPAAEMEDQLPERVKEERNQDLLALVDAIVERKNHAHVGQTHEVLCEGPSRYNKERLTGRTRTNRIVIFDGNANRLSGQLFDVKIEECSGFTLYGNPVITPSPGLHPVLQ